MRPRFAVLADGVDVTGRLASLGAEISVTDAAGVESDRMAVTLDDLDGAIAPPRTGAELQVWLGDVAPTVYMGRFVVDQVDYEGWPQKVRITARSADQRKSLKERRTKDYEETTLGEIFDEIAGRNDLTADVPGDLAEIEYDYASQEEESDQAFATRLGRRHGATVTVKEGRLIVRRRGQGGLGPLTISPGFNLVDYRVSYTDRAKHKEVVAAYWDRDKAKRVEITEPADGQGSIFRLREPYPSEEKAREAAKGKARELKRAKAEATFTIEGDPRAAAEMDVVVSGARAAVDGLWVSERVQHRWGPRAATTTITCKPKE